MKGNLAWVVTGLVTLCAPLCVEALATVESRTGESPVYASEEPRARSSVVALNAPAEDRAALLSLKHLEHLKQEISELRGLVETQGHEIQQLKKSQQDFYADVDKRLNQLQSTKGTVSSKAASKTLVVVPPAKGKSSITIVPTGTTPSAAVSTESKAIEDPVVSEFSASTSAKTQKSEIDSETKPISPVSEKATYEAAYSLVRTKHYPEATSAFENYLTQFKDGEHAANAHYWMGEIAMVEWQKNPQNKSLLDKAAQAFSNVASQFPGNPKVSDALLKLGIVENEKGNTTAARKYFTDVKSRYPGSAAARIAETRLKQL